MTDDPPEGPWDDAELVIYSAGAEHGDADPQTEWAQELGVVSYSLWARYEDKGTEIPIYGRSETGVWFSLSAEQFHPDPADPVSDAFKQAIVNMVDEDVGDGWGDPSEAVWDAMTDIEKQLWHATNWAFLKMDSPEAAMVIDWCQKHTEADDA